MFSLILFFTILYQEFVLQFSTGTGFAEFFARTNPVHAILWGIALAALSLLPTRKWKFRLLKVLMLFAIGVLYAVTYFVQGEFGVFYSFRTIAAGAGGALDEFQLDIQLLLFSASGILHLFLFFAPTILYAAVAFLDKRPHGLYRKEGALVVLAITALVCGIWYAGRTQELYEHFTLEYDFDSAVREYGLLTGMCLEARDMLNAGNVAFEQTDTSGSGFFGFKKPNKTSGNLPGSGAKDVSGNETGDVSGNTDAQTALTQKEPVFCANAPQEETVDRVYMPNVLPIDFDALAASTNNGTWASMDNYVKSVTPTCKNEYTGLFEGKNLILITAEAFTAEAIDPERTPTLYRMATKGIQFTDFYQPASAGTTGGEYGVLMAMLPTNGGASMKITANNHNYMTMGTQMARLGYYGRAYHNNSYTYYDRHLTHINLGYSDGYFAKGNGMEQFIKSQWPESDLEMMQCTLPEDISKAPFSTYYMSVSGHSLYMKTHNAMSKKHWEEVENLEYSDLVKGYLACQIELDAAMEYTIQTLEEAGIADDTVIVICADHFPYGLDTETQGYKYTNLEELYGQPVNDNLVRDHNRLIIWSGCLEDEEPIVVDSPTFSPDITPTLLNLFGIPYDSRLFVGRDALDPNATALMFNLGNDWETDAGRYISSKGEFTPSDESYEIPEDYIKTVKSIVRNKISYGRNVLETDYYYHVFGPDYLNQ